MPPSYCFHGEAISIGTKNRTPYLWVSAPDAEKTSQKKNTAGGRGENELDKIREELEELKNAEIKRNRDNLDALYNLDLDNMSSSVLRLFQSWTDGIASSKAALDLFADEMGAQFNLFAQWQSETEKSLASITGTVNEQGAALTLLTQWQNDTTTSISSLENTVSEFEARFTLLAQWQNEVNDSLALVSGDANEWGATLTSLVQWRDEVNHNMAAIQEEVGDFGSRIQILVSSEGELTQHAAGIIVQAINDAPSSVVISADHIALEGSVSFVTREELADEFGTTNISGNHIVMDMPYSAGSAQAQSYLRFTHDDGQDIMAYLRTKNEGAGSPEDARYALVVHTGELYDYQNGKQFVALKLESEGAMSMESTSLASGIYIGSYGYLSLTADENVRIRANAAYEEMRTGGNFAPSLRDYVFATDGIYYRGVKILSV